MTNKGEKKIQLLGVHLPQRNEIQTTTRMLNDRQGPKEKLTQDLLDIPKKARKYLKETLKEGGMFYVAPYKKNDTLTENPKMIVKLPKGKILNIQMMLKGFAWMQPEELNFKWKSRFNKAFKRALKDKKGVSRIWFYRQKFLQGIHKKNIQYRGQKRIRFMNFNVENLFDTQIDINNKNDRYFLPISLKQSSEHKAYCAKKWGYRKKSCLQLDWSESRLKKKLRRINEVIFRDKIHPPDVIILQEVENYEILRRLRDEYFPRKNYRIYHYESRDSRGIDVAIMSRLNLAEMPGYYEIKFEPSKNSRGILKSTFSLPNGELLTVMGFHFPSQRSDTSARRQALTFLNRLRSTLPQDRMVIAAGDCNITLYEEKELYPQLIYGHWDVSHKTGCFGCKGTSFYPRKKSWSFFDVFYFSKNLTQTKAGDSGWKVLHSSIRTANDINFQNIPFRYVKKDSNKKIEIMIPNNYREPNYSGISDHWPVVVDIIRKNNQNKDQGL